MYCSVTHISYSIWKMFLLKRIFILVGYRCFITVLLHRMIRDMYDDPIKRTLYLKSFPSGKPFHFPKILFRASFANKRQGNVFQIEYTSDSIFKKFLGVLNMQHSKYFLLKQHLIFVFISFSLDVGYYWVCVTMLRFIRFQCKFILVYIKFLFYSFVYFSH